MKIIKIESSPNKNKRLRAIFDNGQHVNFGLKGGHTYIDGESEVTRTNYRNRHLANGAEGIYIKKFIISPALLSYYILWGDSRSIRENVKSLNDKIKNISYDRV